MERTASASGAPYARGAVPDPATTPVFSAKLDRLADTVATAVAADLHGLAAAVAGGRDRFAIAVGSGGSAASAAYLAACRDSLGAPPTAVQTPLELAVGTRGLGDAQVWLFSAGGDNPDALGALAACADRQAGSVHVVTTNAAGALARRAAVMPGGHVHVLPVADRSDGFLATHSLVATVAALLFASDACSGAHDPSTLRRGLEAAAADRLSTFRRSELRSAFGPLGPTDTLLLLVDPRLAAAAYIIETSAWEAALCPVQRTDVRNFAHGRHVWLARRRAEAFMVALTGDLTREAWRDMDALLPQAARRLVLDYANCGRFQAACAVLDALGVVEAMGAATGVDPGRPGAGPFAAPIYEAPSLLHLARRLTPAVRQKQAAAQLRDDPVASHVDVAAEGAAARERLAAARFGGLVLDYDGTVVRTGERFSPPDWRITDELGRLLDAGVGLAIATGRGGSAGEALREALPARHHRRVLVGYYNGAHLRPLSEDIRDAPPARDPDIAEALAWLRGEPGLLRPGASEPRDSGVQLTIPVDDLADADGFLDVFQARWGAEGRLRATRSGHSVDVCLAEACKTAVVDALQAGLSPADAAILCVGDSGGPSGNDHALLGSPFGISVGQVCGRGGVCWPLFGPGVTGPAALLRILRALRPVAPGMARLDLAEAAATDPRGSVSAAARAPAVDVAGTGFTALDRLYKDQERSSEALGGSCGNVLLSLAMLGRAVAPVLALGDDEVGAALLERFARAGAETRFIARRRGAASPVVAQLLDPRAGRHEFSFTCPETARPLPRYQPINGSDLQSAGSVLGNCTVFYVDRLSPSIVKAMEAASAGGAVVFFEPSQIEDEGLFDCALLNVDILKSSADRLGWKVLSRPMREGAVTVVTYGADGLEAAQRGMRARAPAVPAATVRDTCGAGDMVSVGLIDWLLERLTRCGAGLPALGDLMYGIRAGQRLAAANCAFEGARGIFEARGAVEVRSVLRGAS